MSKHPDIPDNIRLRVKEYAKSSIRALLGAKDITPTIVGDHMLGNKNFIELVDRYRDYLGVPTGGLDSRPRWRSIVRDLMKTSDTRAVALMTKLGYKVVSGKRGTWTEIAREPVQNLDVLEQKPAKKLNSIMRIDIPSDIKDNVVHIIVPKHIKLLVEQK
ncbi:hypothetical protein [Aeromonas phage phiWae14]|nr:hypothetical protein [Aeromonas phage phiWae14]